MGVMASIKINRYNMKNSPEELNFRLEILKLELSTLTAKIGHSIDNLWKIRQFSLGLWTAVVSIGLGQFSQGYIDPTLLIGSVLLPIMFFYIDWRYQIWYWKIFGRENEISNFFNANNYSLPQSKSAINPNTDFNEKLKGFPIYDISGTYTFGDTRGYNFSSYFYTRIPIIIYGFQFLASCIICVIRIRF
jgi:hypothetical protein